MSIIELINPAKNPTSMLKQQKWHWGLTSSNFSVLNASRSSCLTTQTVLLGLWRAKLIIATP